MLLTKHGYISKDLLIKPESFCSQFSFSSFADRAGNKQSRSVDEEDRTKIAIL
jgi:hypothetical protein